ncbi:hypothetical protein AG1IA_01208 [Rhizoctonia solani AG-1 IA]|uniref:Uncharacterized protein n=1 Tax=Thanatephorus cucumeris (strain AG1-IA) TaxID=983506 RepID=L8X819_THACA|nr:hypothetical protein AG1IA_01208 [Rhizoctonia solani AG-1 IA]
MSSGTEMELYISSISSCGLPEALLVGVDCGPNRKDTSLQSVSSSADSAVPWRCIWQCLLDISSTTAGSCMNEKRASSINFFKCKNVDVMDELLTRPQIVIFWSLDICEPSDYQVPHACQLLVHLSSLDPPRRCRKFRGAITGWG